MIKIENVEVVGWEHTIRGMRNPKNSWALSDSVFSSTEGDYYTINGNSGPCSDDFTVEIGPNDHKLMSGLAKGGPVHAKYRRMIVVYLDITAPLYWWKEFDTYKVGTVANSCSTMHKIHDKEFTLDDFSHEHLLPHSIDILNAVIHRLNVCRNAYCYGDGLVKGSKEYWLQMIQLLPTSYNQKRTIMLNYEVLHNIYFSRKHHKLDEWHVLCDWIESLPYSEIITTKVKLEESTN